MLAETDNRATLAAFIRRNITLALFASLNPKQREVVRSKNTRKALIACRQAGKTFLCAFYLLITSLTRPSNCLYLAITRQQAKKLLWEPLKATCNKWGIKATFSETELVATFPNGSKIWLAGAQDADDIEKFRGFQFDLVILDEAQAFRQHITQLVEDVIEPTLGPTAGTLLVVGTPGPVPAGYFYRVTQESKFSFDTWTATLYDNPKYPLWADIEDYKAEVDKLLAAKLKEKGWTKDNPTYCREWLGLWIKDLDALIYHLDNAQNWSVVGPDTKHVLGLDMGHVDQAGFVVVGYSQSAGKVYERETYQKAKMPIGDIITKARELAQKYNTRMIVVDPAAGGNNLVSELSTRYNLPCQVADKQDKGTYMRMFDDAIRVNEFLFSPESEDLKEQMKIVPWNDKKTREEEGYVCDLADSALYAFRYTHAYLTKKAEPKQSREDRAFLEELKKGEASNQAGIW